MRPLKSLLEGSQAQDKGCAEKFQLSCPAGPKLGGPKDKKHAMRVLYTGNGAPFPFDRLLVEVSGVFGGAIKRAEQPVHDSKKFLPELHEDGHDHGENKNIFRRGLPRLILQKLIEYC
jgi:hypothetical protein